RERHAAHLLARGRQPQREEEAPQRRGVLRQVDGGHGRTILECVSHFARDPMASTAPLKVAVMGAGAVGCYFGGMLARAGHAVTLIARPQHGEAIARDGLRMETKTFDERVRLAATTEVAGARDADLVLFSVKSPDTEAAGRELKPFLRPDTLVLCLQNGVDNAERLRTVLPE